MGKRIQLLNTQGNKLDGILFPGKKKSLIILCHGFGGQKEDFGIKKTAMDLNNHGYSTFIFDFTGQGKSEGKKEFDLEQQVEDLDSILDLFKPTYDEVIVLGGSMGGLVSTLTAMKRGDIGKLILINPFLYIGKGVNWHYTTYLIGMFLIYPFNKRVRSICSYYFRNFHPSRLEHPTLIIVGKKDAKVSPLHSHQFHRDISCEKKIVIDDEIDHEISKQRFVDRTVSAIINWLEPT